jgi:hypothetical protein
VSFPPHLKHMSLAPSLDGFELLRSAGWFLAISPLPNSPVTSGYCYTPGGDYCAPGCQPLSSPIQPYPQQVQQPLPQCLHSFKGTTSSFERPQRRAKLSRMLAGRPSLEITLYHHFPRGPQKFPALFGSGVDSNYPALYQYPKDISESG